LYGAYLLESTMKVAKWGNSLAVRLTASVVEALDLRKAMILKFALQTGARLRSPASLCPKISLSACEPSGDRCPPTSNSIGTKPIADRFVDGNALPLK
jgi:hypothetical protein